MKIAVGEGSCGIAAGAAAVYSAIEAKIAEKSCKADLRVTGCVGMCFLEPIVDMYFDDGSFRRLVRVRPQDAEAVVAAAAGDVSAVDSITITAEDESFLTQQTRIALRHCGVIDPTSLDDYIAADGYRALRKTLAELTPEGVIDIIKMSGLGGRGGARRST